MWPLSAMLSEGRRISLTSLHIAWTCSSSNIRMNSRPSWNPVSQWAEAQKGHISTAVRQFDYHPIAIHNKSKLDKECPMLMNFIVIVYLGRLPNRPILLSAALDLETASVHTHTHTSSDSENYCKKNHQHKLTKCLPTVKFMQPSGTNVYGTTPHV